MYLSDYKNIAEARQQIGHFIDMDYQYNRIHSGLNYQTPAEVEEGWQRNPPSAS